MRTTPLLLDRFAVEMALDDRRASSRAWYRIDAMESPLHTTATEQSERRRIASEFVAQLRGPLNALAVVWLVLVLLDLNRVENSILTVANDVIWGIFSAAFLVELWVAPQRKQFLKENWFAALTLLIPALRLARVLRGVRFLAKLRGLRGLTIGRAVASLNKGLYAMNRLLRRHQLGYVIAVTVVVVLVAASIIFHFERTEVLGRPASGGAIDTFGDALWWAGGAASFAGSDYEVRTNVGRAMRLFMSFYSWSGFGYLTATVASHFLDPVAEEDAPDPITVLTSEVQALRREVAQLREHFGVQESAESAPETDAEDG